VPQRLGPPGATAVSRRYVGDGGHQRPRRDSRSATIASYKRNCRANLFIFLDVHRPWRKVKVMDGRSAIAFAAWVRELADVHFLTAERIRVVPDSVHPHGRSTLSSLPPAEIV
jgi:hypothetical protein